MKNFDAEGPAAKMPFVTAFTARITLETSPLFQNKLIPDSTCPTQNSSPS